LFLKDDAERIFSSPQQVEILHAAHGDAKPVALEFDFEVADVESDDFDHGTFCKA
jgi:hypothetical protein